MGEDEPPDVIGDDDSSFEDFVAGSSARLFTMARLRSRARPRLASQPIRVTLAAGRGNCGS